MPDKCERGQFCPDEMDACQPLLPLGSPCQLNRDDQCEAPPNFSELLDTAGRGLNFNGSVCLNNTCMWANVTVGQPCMVENKAYTGYESSGEFIHVVSRGDCRVGLYCDARQRVCMPNKMVGEACTGDKECDSWNCLSTGFCGVDAATPVRFATWVYIVVALNIIGGMVGVLIGLFVVHRKQRRQELEKRAQYWREQNTLHQNLLQMRETARNSLLSLPNHDGSTIYGANSDDVHAPILQHAAAPPRGSGLRSYFADDGSSEEGIMMQPSPNRR